jgi:hypothetical protein
MKAIEFINENEATTSGSIAVVPFAFSDIQRRNDKYPNNVKKVKGNARRRFKNSISN